MKTLITILSVLTISLTSAAGQNFYQWGTNGWGTTVCAEYTPNGMPLRIVDAEGHCNK